MINRRGLITGLISLVAAPAIIRVNHLMPINVFEDTPIEYTVIMHQRTIWVGENMYNLYKMERDRFIKEYISRNALSAFVFDKE